MPPNYGYGPQGDPIYFQTNARGDLIQPSYGYTQRGDPIYIESNARGDALPQVRDGNWVSRESLERLGHGALNESSASDYDRYDDDEGYDEHDDPQQEPEVVEKQAEIAFETYEDVIKLERADLPGKPSTIFRRVHMYGISGTRGTGWFGTEGDKVDSKQWRFFDRDAAEAASWRYKYLSVGFLVNEGYLVTAEDGWLYPRSDIDAAAWRVENATTKQEKQSEEQFLEFLTYCALRPKEVIFYEAMRDGWKVRMKSIREAASANDQKPERNELESYQWPPFVMKDSTSKPPEAEAWPS